MLPISCRGRVSQQFISGNDEDAPRIVWQASPAVNRHRAGSTLPAALDAALMAGVAGSDFVASRHVHKLREQTSPEPRQDLLPPLPPSVSPHTLTMTLNVALVPK